MQRLAYRRDDRVCAWLNTPAGLSERSHRIPVPNRRRRTAHTILKRACYSTTRIENEWLRRPGSRSRPRPPGPRIAAARRTPLRYAGFRAPLSRVVADID